METPDTSLRRAPRTYGRRRDLDVSDADASFPAESSASSYQSSPAFSESGRDVPPSSDVETSFVHADDDGEDALDDDLPAKFSFGWKQKLQRIDMEYDDDMEGAPPRAVATDRKEGSAGGRPRPTHGISAGDDVSTDDEDAPAPKNHFRSSVKDDLARIDKEFDAASDMGPHKGPVLPLSSAGDPDDPFGGPLSQLTDDSQPTQAKEPLTTLLRSPSLQPRRVKKRRPVVNASDSELEDGQHSSPQSSPGALHPINTPRHSSSPTPPTTQEMANRKGKGKEKARSETPADEESEELPTLEASKAHGKTRGKRKEREKRVKAPTRKERAETQKTMARIKADQQVALPKQETRLRVTDLWEKLRPKLNMAKQAAEPPSEGSMSDPIQPFSSPIQTDTPLISFVPKPSALRPTSRTRSRSRTVEPQLELFAPTNLLGGNVSRSRLTASSSRQRNPRTPSPAGDMFVSTGLLGDISHGADEASDDEELFPEVSSLVRQSDRKREAEQQKQKLTDYKMRLLKNPQPVYMDDDSDLEVLDNDMHVVAKEEAKERQAAKARHARPSVGRKNQLTLAGRSVAHSPAKKGTLVHRNREDLEVMQAAAAPAFSVEARAELRKGKERATGRVGPKDLNKMLLRASEKQSKEITRQKEQEYYKREGPPRDRVDGMALGDTFRENLQRMIAKGIHVARKQEHDEDGDDEAQDDESDGEWTPDMAQDDDAGEQEADDTDENEVLREVSMASETEEDQDEETNVRHRPQRRNVMVIDSDDDAENIPTYRAGQDLGRVLVADSSLVLDSQPAFMLNHRRSVSSIDEHLEEGTDKENDSRLMFDRGEDKENTVIAGSSTLSPTGLVRGRGSLISLGGSIASLPIASQETTDERTPFKELHKEDKDDVFLSSPTRLPLSRTASTRQGTPGTPKHQPINLENVSPLQLRSAARKESQGLAAFFESSTPPDKGKGRLSDNEPFSLQPAAVISSGSGGLSEFFEPTLKNSAAVHTARGDGFSQFFSPGKDVEGFGTFNKGDSLDLSLESNLQPSLHVNKSLVRKADEMFEREQEAVAARAVANEKVRDADGMYVNEHGFLTQTEPNTALPAWALASPTSPLFAQSSPAFQTLLKSTAKERQPLGTIALALDDDQDSDDGRPRRLKKRGSTPELDDVHPKGKYRSSTSPSPVKARNAFEVLGRKQEKLKAPKFTRKLQKSAYIQGEAEESDEDAGFGFGLINKKDDEEESDGEEQDKMIDGLVDDAVMDDDTLAEEKVYEKVKEHQALDDAADEKIARDAAEGKLRIKKRNLFVDFEDDESDEEEEDAQRRRQKMAKKRKIAGDSLEQLARNPATEAFVKAYQADIEDDNEELAHLDRDEMSLTFGDENADDGQDDDEDDDEEPQEVVSAVKLQEQLRRVARGKEVVKTIDIDDVRWVSRDEDEDMNDENIRIKEVTSASSRSAPRGPKPNQMEWENLQQPRREDSIQDMTRQQQWARSEGGSRNAGTGRASAVTGHSKSARAGGGSIVGRRSEQGQAQKKSSAKLAKAPSALSAVSDKRARFA